MYRFVIKSGDNWNNGLMDGEPNFKFSVPVRGEIDLNNLSSADWMELNTRSSRVNNRAFKLKIDYSLQKIIDEINRSTVCFYNIALAREAGAPPPKKSQPPKSPVKDAPKSAAPGKVQPKATPAPPLTELPPMNTSFPGQCSAGVVNANIPGNSVINAHNLSVSESIPLVGMPFYLTYSSDRYLQSSNFSKNKAQIGGWTLSQTHFYDSKSKILYLGDGGLRNVEALPFADGKTLYIAAANRPEAYILNSEGIHQQTVNTITGKMLYGFQYDSKLRLSLITDQFGNKTTIQYTDNSADIFSQGGQHNLMALDESGMLAKVESPSMASFQMTYDKNKRILSFQKPTGEVSRFLYDHRGSLIKDEGAGGSSLALTGVFDPAKSTQLSTVTTSLGRVTNYSTVLVAGAAMSTATSANGGISKSTSMRDASGYVDIYGSTFQAKHAADPRFGWQVPYEASTIFKTANGEINLSIETKKDILKSFDKDILKLMKETTKVTLQKDPSRTFVSEYDSGKKQYSLLTPMNRKTIIQSNDFSQVLSVQAVGIEAVRFNYDQKGQLATIIQGEKLQSYEYDPNGNVIKAIDPTGISTSFKYNADNKLIEKVFADGRSIGFSYDKAGNIASITPPGKPQHNFARNSFQFIS
ncbi:MAG: hypothetical protein J7497_14450, partial [Chitinophagaceae bacterium]|nr:hypothetical protein [Chitinophagaceae bacterium]